MTLTGRVMAGDLRRLEHACAPALERQDMSLELWLATGTTLDTAARAFVERLVSRGARVVDAASDTE